MNRFINATLLFVALPTLFLTITVGLDLPVRFMRVTGSNFPYHEEIFLGLGLFILILNIRRSVRRWMGMRVVSKKDKFKWNIAVSSKRTKRVSTYLILESTVMLVLAFGLLTLTDKAWMPAIGFAYGGLDGLLFMLIGIRGKRYRVGLSSKALIVADREVTLLYFTGLREVTVHQDSIYFDYIKGLQLLFPLDCIPEEKRDEFFQHLENSTNRDKVYFRMKT